jgi:hypothetical protein
MNKNLLYTGSLLALVGVASCGDVTPVAPTMAASPARRALTGSGAEEAMETSQVLTNMNLKLAAAGSKLRVAKAELIMNANTWNGVGATILVPKDTGGRGIGAEWVKGDPRRDYRQGVTYAARAVQRFSPYTLDGTANGRVADATVAAHIEEGMQAWRDRSCSSAPMVSVPIPAGTDPDLVDDLVSTGAPSATWAQPADIVHSGFVSPAFFLAIGGPDNGPYILGVTFTFSQVDETTGEPTDIDHNGKGDIGLAEIYYNPGWFYWTSVARSGSTDFYSVLTHETGHSLGLDHWGKLFVTKHDGADGIQITDIKYAPYAIMNAAYVDGRNEIAGTDNSSFCQIWASK